MPKIKTNRHEDPAYADMIERLRKNSEHIKNYKKPASPNDVLDKLEHVIKVATLVYYKKYNQHLAEYRIRWLYGFLFDQIINTLLKEAEFNIKNFGKFKMNHRKATQVRDPETGQYKINIPAVKQVVFKLSWPMKAAINNMSNYRARVLETYDEEYNLDYVPTRPDLMAGHPLVPKTDQELGRKTKYDSTGFRKPRKKKQNEVEQNESNGN